MADVIISGASVIAPTVILGYQSTREGGTIVHPIINRASPDASLRVASLRTGRMEMGFAAVGTAEADSAAAEALLATAAVFSLTSSERATVQLQFVVPEGGSIVRTLEDNTRSAWTVAFDWVEVVP